MVYGLLFSAGTQKRFEAAYPKALQRFCDGTTLLERNIANMYDICDRVYVVCSYTNKEWFDNCDKIIIDSGKGCGDAVMQALNALPLNPEDCVCIQWGDSLQHEKLYTTMRDTYDGRVIIPCVWEREPYVNVAQTLLGIRVTFSKYEECSAGYHDQSIFFGNATRILASLTEFAERISTPDGYQHKHGNEMQFLDVFNETDLEAVILPCEQPNLCFNTIKEFEDQAEKFDFST